MRSRTSASAGNRRTPRIPKVLDALASAVRREECVEPFDGQGDSIRARVCADAIEGAGADRVVTLDLHAPQMQGFFRVPVDDLYAADRLCGEIDEKVLTFLEATAGGRLALCLDRRHLCEGTAG